MDARIFRLMLCVALWAAGHDCHQWSSQFSSGTVKYACVGSTAVLPWAVTLNNGEDIHDIQWHFDGPSGRQTVAFFASGMFMPGPAFAQRVSYVPNAGIMLTGLTKNDTGNYSVEVTGRNASLLWSLEHTGFIQVLDGALVSSTGLHLKQEATAIYDNATGQWMVDLSCGDFPFPGQPPFDVKWTTPSGSVKPSSHYEHGKFHLLLTESEASGTYTCQAPDHNSCSHSHSTNLTGPAASIDIDNVKARLALLEARLKDNKASSDHLSNLTQQNSLLGQNNKLILEQNTKLMDERADLMKQNGQTAQDNAKLSQRLNILENNFNQLSTALAKANSSHNNSSQTCCGLNQTVNDLQQTMIQEISRLTDLLQQQSARIKRNDHLCSVLGQQAKGLGKEMNQTHEEITSLKHDVSFLQNQVNHNSQQSASTIPGSVHFHVRNSDKDNSHAHPHEVLRLSDLVDNKDSRYNPHTGVFTAPVSGTYFFLATSEIHAECHPSHGHDGGQHCVGGHGGFSLISGNKVLDSVELIIGMGPEAHNSHTGTVHSVVHLNQGGTIWLQNVREPAQYRPGAISFSGFLISKD